MSRVVARESRLRQILDLLGRGLYACRRSRMRAAKMPRLAIIPDDEIGLEILQFGIYERRLLGLLFDDVFSGFRDRFLEMTVLDIGANIGNHSVYLARRFRRVVAFEPGSVAFHLLCANRSLNGCANIDPYQVGISSHDGQAYLVQVQSDNIGSNAVTGDANAGSAEEIALRRGDGFLESLPGLPPIGLVKIDVEGHEIEALRSLEKTLRAYRPIILFETTGKYGATGSDALVELLRSFGYRNFYTLAKDFPLPRWRSPIFRMVLRLVLGASYVLTSRENFDDRYYNLAIATIEEQLI